MSDFPSHFREHVCPRLRNLARAEAFCFAQGVETFPGAMCALWQYARSRGAFFLPDQVQDDLRDWLLTQLSEAIEEQLDKAPIVPAAQDAAP